MLDLPEHHIDDEHLVRELVDRYPWATIVSQGLDGAPVVSHLPVVVDPRTDDATVLSHLARVDADEHRLGEVDVVLILQGPEGYVSPQLYRPHGPYVPTWNFVVLHLHGVPEILDPETTWDVLDDTVRRFEREYAHPWELESVREYADRLRPAVTGFRLRPNRIVTKAKLSQDKPREVVQQLLDGFESDGPFANPALAAAMRELGGAGE